MRIAIATILLLVAHASGHAQNANTSARAALLELRHVINDAMYRNDAESLELALASLEKISGGLNTLERAYVDYYASLAYWALSATQLQANDVAGALKSGQDAVRHARAGVDARPKDPEFYAQLANALIVVAILDRPNFASTATELAPVRRQALALGPENPRVVFMDAGMIFNSPPERGGGREKGLARWREALTLFEREATTPPTDPLAPRWGHALAWGWLANTLLSADQSAAAREAATTALLMRPDFWYVKEQLLPKLR